jgi:hypothetical protein
MWEPRCVTNLWTSTAGYKDTVIIIIIAIILSFVASCVCRSFSTAPWTVVSVRHGALRLEPMRLDCLTKRSAEVCQVTTHYSCRCLITFRSEMLPPSSEWKKERHGSGHSMENAADLYASAAYLSYIHTILWRVWSDAAVAMQPKVRHTCRCSA